MASLKDLRLRIRSVKSTQKITSAMKMVAAAKLRRSQDAAIAARPYAERLERLLAGLASRVTAGAPPLLGGTGKDENHLVIVAAADRGLCGNFNSSIMRDARDLIRGLLRQGKNVRIFCVGRKAREQLSREYGKLIVGSVELAQSGKKRIGFADADAIAQEVLAMFMAGNIDVATIVYSRFRSAISQIVTRRQLIPVPPADEAQAKADSGIGNAVYEYEPDEADILKALLPRNIAVQIFRAMLENSASFYGAQMTAMDNATRNAGDMIDRLTLNYNRTRQGVITKELIEIISGAEAV
jgi:F-type H+-transporting ATPase subunit gamma